MLLANQIAVGGATVSVGLKTNEAKLRALSFYTEEVTLLGISEPAI